MLVRVEAKYVSKEPIKDILSKEVFDAIDDKTIYSIVTADFTTFCVDGKPFNDTVIHISEEDVHKHFRILTPLKAPLYYLDESVKEQLKQ